MYQCHAGYSTSYINIVWTSDLFGIIHRECRMVSKCQGPNLKSILGLTSYERYTRRVTGQNPPPPPDRYPPDTYPKDTYPPVTYPLDTYPLDIYPLGHIPPSHLPPGHLPPGHLPPRTYTPQDIYPLAFKMPYLVHASCVDYILHFIKHLFCRNSIYLWCRCNKADRYLLFQEGLMPTTTQALDSWWGGGGVFSMSDVNSDKYPSQSFNLE